MPITASIPVPQFYPREFVQAVETETGVRIEVEPANLYTMSEDRFINVKITMPSGSFLYFTYRINEPLESVLRAFLGNRAVLEQLVLERNATKPNHTLYNDGN